MAFAFVFPGQGSQSVGMLASLSAGHPIVRATFDEASQRLGYDLWQITQEGPQERLDATECTQPAMLAAGIATWRLWRQHGGGKPAAVSGHSLGEFTALVCAEALSFSDGIDLVRFRGQAMQAAVPAGTGSMAAILGLDDAVVSQVCAEAARHGVVEAVNFNSPGQVVIAGESGAVQQAIELAKGRGAKRALLLPVSVPSHSRLMLSAGERLAERLETLEMRPPRLRYLSPVDVRFHDEPGEIRAHLTRQLSSPVQWTATVRALVAEGMTAIVECGPGKVLTGLNRRIARDSNVEFLALEDPASVEAAVTRLRAPDTSSAKQE